jgi:hypothetical protein
MGSSVEGGFNAPGVAGTGLGLPSQPMEVTTPSESTSNKQRNERFIISFLKNATGENWNTEKDESGGKKMPPLCLTILRNQIDQGQAVVRPISRFCD